jgi:hypothetical protein
VTEEATHEQRLAEVERRREERRVQEEALAADLNGRWEAEERARRAEFEDPVRLARIAESAHNDYDDPYSRGVQPFGLAQLEAERLSGGRRTDEPLAADVAEVIDNARAKQPRRTLAERLAAMFVG